MNVKACVSGLILCVIIAAGAKASPLTLDDEKFHSKPAQIAAILNILDDMSEDRDIRIVEGGNLRKFIIVGIFAFIQMPDHRAVPPRDSVVHEIEAGIGRKELDRISLTFAQEDIPVLYIRYNQDPARYVVEVHLREKRLEQRNKNKLN